MGTLTAHGMTLGLGVARAPVARSRFYAEEERALPKRYAEAAMGELRSSLTGLRLLLRPEPWRYPETRRRIREGVRRGAGRVVRRLLRAGI